MSEADWLKLVAILVTLATSIAAGGWALYRFRRSSPYSAERARRYEEVYQTVCIGTIPRMSSYDWKSSAARLGVPENALPPEYRNLISKAEGLDPRYGASAAANSGWIRERVLRGEELLDNHRLYIDKQDRDLFREYLVLAAAYADSSDPAVLDKLFKLRNKLTRVTGTKLRSYQR